METFFHLLLYSFFIENLISTLLSYDMCYRPLTLKSSSMHYSCDKDPLLMAVPCGHCEECRNMMRQEWFVRSFYEWKRVRSLGGNGYFYTLTYNDENIPTYNGVRCFSYEHCKNFFKRLKERLRTGYSISLTYLLTCEYGSISSRPHYHVDFFLDKYIMPFTFYKIVEDCWPYGFVYAGKGTGIIDSSNALLYTTKYITKDMFFDDNSRNLREMLNHDYSLIYEHEYSSDTLAPSWSVLCSEPVRWTDTPYKDIYNNYMSDYRHRSIFHLSSTHFGQYLMSQSDMFDTFKETCLVPDKHGYRSVPLPRFIKRALWYDVIPNDKDGKCNRFVLNERGVQHKLDTLEYRISKLEKTFKDFFSSVRLTDGQFTQLKLTSPFKFDGNNDFTHFLRHIDIDFHRLAIYTVVYHNRVPLIYEEDYTHNIYQPNLFSDYAQIYSLSMQSALNRSIPRIHCYEDARLFRELFSKLYNFDPQLSIYYHFLLLYQSLNKVLKKDYYRLLNEKDDNRRKASEILKLKVS